MKAELVAYAVKDNQDAHDFLLDLWRSTSVWDDLIDQDKGVTRKQINDAFWIVFVKLPLNPFYQKHIATLFPLLQNWILTWHGSNEMSIKLSQIPACAGSINLTVTCAYLIGGKEHAVTTAALCWNELMLDQLNKGV